MTICVSGSKCQRYTCTCSRAPSHVAHVDKFQSRHAKLLYIGDPNPFTKYAHGFPSTFQNSLYLNLYNLYLNLYNLLTSSNHWNSAPSPGRDFGPQTAATDKPKHAAGTWDTVGGTFLGFIHTCYTKMPKNQ